MTEEYRCETCGNEIETPIGRCINCGEVESRLFIYIQSDNGFKFVLKHLLEEI